MTGLFPSRRESVLGSAEGDKDARFAPSGENGRVALAETEERAAPSQADARPKSPLEAMGYLVASLLLGLTQGFGLNLVAANIPQIQGSLGATTLETTWLVAAYMAPNVSLSLLLIKIRTQYGLRNFAELSILGFVGAAFLHFYADELRSAIIVRFVSGIAAAPLSSLAFLYMMEAFPASRKLTTALPLVLTNIALAVPIARLISPALLDIGAWPGLYTLEIGLALLSFCAVYLLPLPPAPRAKVIEALDIVSYLLIALGFGLTAIVLSLGRLYWWTEARWMGVCLAVAIAALTLAALIELNRKRPLLDLRWITSREVLHLTGALLLFRLIMSEQTAGAAGFIQMLGLLNENAWPVYLVMAAATIGGGAACILVMKPGREPTIHIFALSLLAIGAFVESRATSLTRPQDMMLGQAMIAAGGALFLPPAMAAGLSAALKKGPNYILNFVIIFLTTQSLGGLFGSAVLGSFVTIRQAFHLHALAGRITATDPIVGRRMAQFSDPFTGALSDPSLVKAEAMARLDAQATREAAVLAYNDLHLLIASLAAFALTGLLVHLAIRAISRRARRTAQSVAV